MAAPTICNASRDGAACSTVELGDVRHVLATAVPRRGSTLRQQLHEALRGIAAAMEAQAVHGSIVQQAVFVADAGQIESCRRIIADFYGKELPATSYIPQPPCEGALLSIEAWAARASGGPLEIQRINEQLVIARRNGVAWVHCAQVVPPEAAAGVYEGTRGALQRMGAVLGGAGVGFEQVVRTWFYLGGIVAEAGPGARYQELNRARGDFYRGIPFLAGRTDGNGQPAYPASTGIGTEGRGVVLSAIALATDRRDIVAVPLENPRQTPAYQYPAAYSPTSPRFSRAMAVCGHGEATIFISGTASITGSTTQYDGDVAAQTHETLHNIEALISEENLARHHLSGLGTSLAGLAAARVYVKRKEYYAAARAVCQSRWGAVPTIYAIADVCRPELCVEIEGIAFSRKAAADSSVVPPPHFLRTPQRRPRVLGLDRL
jgi:enamine deaminase RidA (YjgF/YER057c/UK114 family)